MDGNNNKWKLEKIKSFRVSPELLEMLNREINARKTTLSQYLRYAAIVQMKTGNQPTQQNAA